MLPVFFLFCINLKFVIGVYFHENLHEFGFLHNWSSWTPEKMVATFDLKCQILGSNDAMNENENDLQICTRITFKIISGVIQDLENMCREINVR